MPLYIIFIIVSFFASILGLQVKENRTPVLISFSFFLFLSAVAEVIGWEMSERYISNLALYNFFTMFEFLFYLFFFRSVFSSSRMKKIILIAIVSYFICDLVDIFFIQKGSFHSYTYVLGCTLVVIFSITYFNFLFRFPETGSLAKNPFFWIGIGLLFYYTCTLPRYGLQNFITNIAPYYDNLLTLIGDLLNIVLYSLFSIGFLCKINFRKLLRLS
jgi:hypothetical protein